jgi:C4-dicarboxylate-specific signal transduction histidine kinase
MSELDVNEVIREVLALAGRVIEENQVSLHCDLAQALPLVFGDRIQLQQVLLNLIMNGIEAMDAITDRPHELGVESRIDENGDVLVAIRDSGSGLGADADRIFDPFYTTKTNGMGMGLSISRTLINNHDGRLWASPNSPHGTVFWLALSPGRVPHE